MLTTPLQQAGERDASWCSPLPDLNACKLKVTSVAGATILAFMVYASSLLAGCTAGQSANRAGDKQTAVEQEQARRAIGNQFTKGLAAYRLVPGDVVELLYMFNSDVQVSDYHIGVGDQIRVDFYNHNDFSRTLLVRPDGRVTLPMKGETMAAGLTPLQLTENIKQIFADTFRNPQVTVTVEKFTSSSQAFARAMGDLDIAGRRSHVFKISPTGQFFPPFVPAVQAAGATVEELHGRVQAAYLDRFRDVTVSVQLQEIAGSRVFVFGEVRNPGAYPLQGPQTVLQAVASAGGWLPTAAPSQVRVVYWDQSGEVRIRSVNLEKVAREGAVAEEVMLTAYSTIYVPPSDITQANRFVDQYLRQLFLFNGTNLDVVWYKNFPR